MDLLVKGPITLALFNSRYEKQMNNKEALDTLFIEKASVDGEESYISIGSEKIRREGRWENV